MGGYFPYHCTHDNGRIVDMRWSTFVKDEATAQSLIALLNTPTGARIEKVQTTLTGDFATHIASQSGVKLADGRRVGDVVKGISRHPTHMHITLFPGGSSAGGDANRVGTPQLSAYGQAWQNRGPRSAAVGTADHDRPVPVDFALAVAPNPVSGPDLRFRVESPVAAEVDVLVYDVRGRVVARLGGLPVGVGASPLTVPVGGLAAGTYLLRVSGPGEAVRSTPFVLVR